MVRAEREKEREVEKERKGEGIGEAKPITKIIKLAGAYIYI